MEEKRESMVKGLNADQLEDVARQVKDDRWETDSWESQGEEKLKFFNFLVGAVILANAALIGAETEVQGQAGPGVKIDKQLEDIFWWGNNVFQGFFIFELLLRLSLERQRWFSSLWNWFDFVCVACAALDLWVFKAIGASADDRGAMKLMTALRVIRLLRLVRLLRVFRMFRELYVICAGLIEAVRSIFWVGVILVLLLYICAIFLTQIVGGDAQIIADLAETPEEMDGLARFGTLFRSMWTLFELTTMEGWTDLARPFLEISPWWAVFFLSFIMIAPFGLLNMIIAMIVEQTLAMSNENDAKQQRRKHKELVEVLRKLKLAFTKADADGSESVSQEEFDSALSKNPQIQQTLHSIGVPPEEARNLFHLLDQDGNGELDCREFLVGCLQLRGPAKAVDAWRAQKEARAVKMELKAELQEIRGEIRGLKEDVIERVLEAIGQVSGKPYQGRGGSGGGSGGGGGGGLGEMPKLGAEELNNEKNEERTADDAGSPPGQEEGATLEEGAQPAPPEPPPPPPAPAATAGISADLESEKLKAQLREEMKREIRDEMKREIREEVKQEVMRKSNERPLALVSPGGSNPQPLSARSMISGPGVSGGIELPPGPGGPSAPQFGLPGAMSMVSSAVSPSGMQQQQQQQQQQWAVSPRQRSASPGLSGGGLGVHPGGACEQQRVAEQLMLAPHSPLQAAGYLPIAQQGMPGNPNSPTLPPVWADLARDMREVAHGFQRMKDSNKAERKERRRQGYEEADEFAPTERGRKKKMGGFSMMPGFPSRTGRGVSPAQVVPNGGAQGGGFLQG